MADVFIALGSNLGDRDRNLAAAREALGRGVMKFAAASSIYETAPWGPVPQGPYLNQVVRGSTGLSPQELLAKLIAIEFSLGRERAHEVRYGARTIDLDILWYDGREIRESNLVVPHPRMMERAFVLVPLAEIAPELLVGDVAVTDALAKVDRTGIERYEKPA
jgi:2-amino-4-hydroxy-6-hydroxymethyldihydropteridine diphosphokinase